MSNAPDWSDISYVSRLVEPPMVPCRRGVIVAEFAFCCVESGRRWAFIGHPPISLETATHLPSSFEAQSTFLRTQSIFILCTRAAVY